VERNLDAEPLRVTGRDVDVAKRLRDVVGHGVAGLRCRRARRRGGEARHQPRRRARAQVVSRQLAGRQRDDFRAAIRLARSLERVDGERIALWGYSLGGGNVQALLIDEPEIAAVAVCVAPVVSGLRSLLHMGGPRHVLRLAAAGLRDGARALRGAEPWRVPATGPPGSRGLLNSPDSLPGFEAMTPADSSWRNALCARAALAPPYRLERKIRRIACPILYCIAEDDDVNPPELGKRAAERAPGGELKLYPGGHYDPFQGETLDRMAYDQIGFLRRALAG